jgi:hypothetical protein
MDSYSKAAMERAMKIQEILLRAMARKITWFQAAEILGFSDRHLRRIRERYQEFGYDGLFESPSGQAFSQAGSAGDGRAGAGAVSRSVFRSERAPFSREAADRTADRSELHLGEGSAAGSGVSGAGPETRGASPPPGATPLAGHVVAHRRQPASVVSRRALV